jgi:hypothetical protein
MKSVVFLRTLSVLVFLLCTMAFACSCKRETLITDMTGETAISESTEQTTPTPTKKPRPTPTPTPASVYIPREELPDGRLFEEGYYAVLPGEGFYMNVFDWYGKQIGSFPFGDGESTQPIGLYTETTLACYWRLNQSEVNPIDTADNSYMTSTPNGFYQMDFSGDRNMVILYNTDGEHIRTLTAPILGESESVDIVVRCLGEETVVSFTVMDWGSGGNNTSYLTTIYFVASDGTINDKCVTQKFPDQPKGLIGREFMLVDAKDTAESPYKLVDFSGNVVKTGIDYMPESTFMLWSDEAGTSIYISDYFTVDGIAFDASLEPLEINQVGPQGELIYGVEYVVQGIPCTEMKYIKAGGFFSDRFFYTDGYEDLVAVGMQNNQIAVKTKDAEYVFDYDGKATYLSINNHFLVLSNMQVISLETGELLPIPSGFRHMVSAEDYLIGGSELDLYSGLITGGYIIDKAGNIRYATGDSSCKPTLGEYILLYRGPYVGIADLNGEWIIKTLASRYTRNI